MLYGWHLLDPNLRLHNTQYIPLKSPWLDICTLQLDLILLMHIFTSWATYKKNSKFHGERKSLYPFGRTLLLMALEEISDLVTISSLQLVRETVSISFNSQSE